MTSPTAYILLIISILIAGYAQMKVSSTFNNYLKVPSEQGFTGGQVARTMLDRHGLSGVPIEVVGGTLSDHYDPGKKSLRLSQDVFYGTSIASISVAAHEVGHAIQHQERYAPLSFRTAIAPIVSISSQFVWILILIGFLISRTSFIDLGILLFLFTVIFQIVTLPVEFNASERAISNLEQGFITQGEVASSKKVLSAAALTYVAATLVAITQLLRLISMRRRN